MDIIRRLGLLAVTLSVLVLAGLALAGGPASAPAAVLTAPASAPAGAVVIAPDAWRYAEASKVAATWPKAPTPKGVLLSDLPTVAAGKPLSFVALANFDLPAAPEPAGYELAVNWPEGTTGTVWLNGKELTGPVPEMVYRTFPGLSPGSVHPGENELAVRAQVRSLRGRTLSPFRMQLRTLTPADLRFDVGPIAGAAGDDFFTVTARTTMPAYVKLILTPPGQLAVEKQETEPGLLHSFRLTDLKAGLYEYRLAASLKPMDKGPAAASPFVVSQAARVQVGPPGETWRFVALGDSRSEPVRWRRVITAAGAAKPLLILHSGDLVANGREYDLWPKEFSAPAVDVLAGVPFYPVMGNHEGEAPIMGKLFPPPPGQQLDYWAQQRGDVLLIGVNGSADWSPEGVRFRWLEDTLSKSKAKYILLTTHYPPYSSSSHGAVDEEGLPKEKPMRVARETLVPLLKRYHATAIIAGHDHCYERSEPDGLTCLTAGGAGAPSYAQAENAMERNPFSKVFADQLHYLVFDVTPEKLTMQALSPEGEQIDSREWTPRAGQRNP